MPGAVCAVLATGTARRLSDPARARGALRTELVTAVGAWPEMASLGAVGQLAQRTGQRLAAFDDRQFARAAAQARAGTAVRAVAAVALVLTVTLAARDGASVSTLVFLTLLAVGVLGSAERLSAAVEARALTRHASERLGITGHKDSTGPGRPYWPAQGPAFRAGYGPGGLTVSGYTLPGTPDRAGRQIGFRVAPAQTLFVTGAPGSGKSTLLDVISSALRHEPGVAIAVLADDYLFTGTIAANVRLANPAATDDDVQDLLTDMRLAAIRRRLPRAVLILAMHELPTRPDVLGPAWTRVPLD